MDVFVPEDKGTAFSSCTSGAVWGQPEEGSKDSPFGTLLKIYCFLQISHKQKHTFVKHTGRIQSHTHMLCMCVCVGLINTTSDHCGCRDDHSLQL